MKGPPAVPASLRAFVERFNRGVFWESHEVLEDAWRATGSDLYHGLILLASAGVHAARGNGHGVRSQCEKAIRALEPCRPNYLGIDVDGLIGDIARRRDACSLPAKWLVAIPFSSIRLEAHHVRGDERELAAS